MIATKATTKPAAAASTQRRVPPSSSPRRGAARRAATTSDGGRGENLEPGQFPHPAECRGRGRGSTTGIARKAAISEPAQPAPAAAARPRAPPPGPRAAISRKAPRLTLVRISAARRAPQARPAPSRSAAAGPDTASSEEGGEQQHAQALRVHRLVGQHGERREGDDHRREPERQAAAQALRPRRRRGGWWRPRSTSTIVRLASVVTDMAEELEQTAEELVVEGPVDRQISR